MQTSRKARPSLVFLHYFGGSARAWDGAIEKLRAEYDCIAPDLRGFGRNSKASGAYTVEAYADDVAELVARRDLDRFVLIGHSMGGKIALAFAARRPAGLEALALLAPSPPTPESMSDDDRAGMVAGYGDRAAALATALKITVRPLAPALLDQVVEDMLASSELGWNAWLEEGSRETIAADLEALSLPSLVVSGTEDSVIPRRVLESEVMRCLSEGRLVSIEGVGHLLPLEAPTEVAALIRGMAGSLARSPQLEAHGASS